MSEAGKAAGRARRFVAHPRHPLTGRQLRLSSRTVAGLRALVVHVEQLRSAYRLGAVSADEIDRQLRRLTRGARTVGRAVQAYVERADIAPHTRRRVRSWLAGVGRPLAGVELDELKAPAIASWLRAMAAGGAAPSTVALAWRTLRGLVRFACELGWVGAEPWGAWRPTSRGSSQVHLFGRECCRSVEELHRLIAAAESTSPELAIKITVAAGLGLRAGELAALRWCDLDPRARVVRLISSGKSAPAELAAPHWVFEACAVQNALLRAAGLWLPSGPVFPSRALSVPGTPRHAAREILTARELRAAVELAGLPHPERWSPHSMRDTFATLELQANAGDLARTMARTRHRSLASLLRYLRESDRGPVVHRKINDLTALKG